MELSFRPSVFSSHTPFNHEPREEPSRSAGVPTDQSALNVTLNARAKMKKTLLNIFTVGEFESESQDLKTTGNNITFAKCNRFRSRGKGRLLKHNDRDESTRDVQFFTVLNYFPSR